MPTAKETLAEYLKTRPKDNEAPYLSPRQEKSFEVPTPASADREKQDQALVQTPAPAPLRLSEHQTPDLPAPAEPVNLESAFADLFKSSTSGSGEEELLRIASTYSRQLNKKQMRLLLFMEWKANKLEVVGNTLESMRLRYFVQRWLELLQFNNSDIFVMKALEHISLRHFLNENSIKVSVEK